jgi:tetratricopeptide (TPR) repeat protein
VRLLKLPDREPVGETFSRPEGRFSFRPLTQGEYLIETFETDVFEASFTSVTIFPPHKDYPMNVHALVELTLKPPARPTKAGVVAADVDVNVPKDAARHYRNGMAALEKGDSPRAIEEFRTAVKLHPDYYAARVELGRELRIKRRFQEAEEILTPLTRIAPRRAEPRIELGIVLLELQRRVAAIAELENALKLQEQNWAPHLYLGWAYLEQDDAKAELHFKKAIELDELKAARAHIALARLANARGERELALHHLNAYLELAPNAHDAGAVRTLAARLRSGN